MLDESQEDRYSAVVKQLKGLPAEQREDALRSMRAKSAEDSSVFEHVSMYFRLPPEPDRCRTGERIGAFTLGPQLGSGGMGVVYQAREDRTERVVALKLIHPKLILTGQSDAVERFQDEIKQLAKFEREGIARIYTAGIHTEPNTSETMPFFTMELVRGGVPITAYAKEHTLTVPDRLRLFLRVCEAVTAAHQQLVIHRDLKPTNILVDYLRRPFVLDFGLAQICDASRRPGGECIAGTPPYMSPEQVSDAFGPVEAMSDVYTLGFILYELLAGRRPLEVPPNASWEVLHQEILTTPPAPLSWYNAECTGDLETIVAKALAKRPADRYRSVADLQREIDAYLTKVERRQLELDVRPAPAVAQGVRPAQLSRENMVVRFSVAAAELASALPKVPQEVAALPDILRGHFQRHLLSVPDDAQLELVRNNEQDTWLVTPRVVTGDASYILQRRGSLIEVLGERFFSPIGAQVRRPLPRREDVQTLETHLLSGPPAVSGGGGLSILVGPSGSGKSTLVKELLLPELCPSVWHCPTPIRGYLTLRFFQQELASRVAASHSSLGGGPAHQTAPGPPGRQRTTLLILDQFEEFLERSTEREREWVKAKFHELLSEPGLTILLVVREEYYSELAFLTKFGDLFRRTVRVSGISMQPPDPDRGFLTNAPKSDGEEAAEKLSVVAFDKEVAQLILKELRHKATILPIEYEAIGFVLESVNAELVKKRGTCLSANEFRKQYGGCQGLIEEYFRRYIDATSDRETAKAVLFTLSSEMRIRRRYRPEDVARITHRDRQTVSRVIGELAGGLLTPVEPGYYVLAHDYLAERFHRLSGTLLHPIDRDNMAFFSDLLSSSPGDLERVELVERRGPFVWFEAVFLLLALVLVARLFFRFWQPFSDPYTEFTWAAKHVVDVLYVPSFLASFSSLLYVRSLFKHFVLIVPKGRILSRVVLGVSCMMIFLGTVEPRLWPLWATIAGLLIGLRIFGFWFAGVRRRSLGRGVLYYVIKLSTYIMVNMLPLGLVGWLVYTKVPERLGGIDLYVVEVVLALGMSGFMAICLWSHATRKNGRILVGSLDRLSPDAS